MTHGEDDLEAAIALLARGLTGAIDVAGLEHLPRPTFTLATTNTTNTTNTTASQPEPLATSKASPPSAPRPAPQPAPRSTVAPATTSSATTQTAEMASVDDAASLPEPGAFIGTVVDIGRLSAGRARGSVAVMALCARYLECSGAEVFRALREAPDDVLVHAVFPSWGKLPTVLLKPAAVALELGLAPLIAIAVGRPVEQVERRLRAVSGDQKVSSVFAPELARRLLREKSPAGRAPT